MGNEASKKLVEEAEGEQRKAKLEAEKYRMDLMKQQRVVDDAQKNLLKIREMANKGYNPSTASQYSLVVNCTSLRDVPRGWRLTVNDPGLKYWFRNNVGQGLDSNSADSALAAVKTQGDSSWQCTVVGVMGFYDRGKTFVLNKLCGRHWISSKRHATEGLSFALVDDDIGHWIVLDTAGFGSPLQLLDAESQDDVDDLFAQGQAMEFFLRDVTFSVSQVIILVINDLTAQDQKFIEMIENRAYSDRKLRRQVLVVHNLKDVSSKAEYDDVWNRQLNGRFRGRQETLIVNALNPLTGQIEPQTARFLRTERSVHLVFVNDFTEFGEAQNPSSVALLRQLVNSYGGVTVEGVELPSMLENECSNWGRVYGNNLEKISLCKLDAFQEDGSEVYALLGNTTDGSPTVHLTEWQMDPYSKQVVFAPKMKDAGDKMGFNWWVYRNNGRVEYYLTLFCPGINRNDIKFKLREGVLSATACLPTGVPEGAEEGAYRGGECTTGNVSMEIKLPSDAVQQLSQMVRVQSPEDYRGLLTLKIPQYSPDEDSFAD